MPFDISFLRRKVETEKNSAFTETSNLCTQGHTDRQTDRLIPVYPQKQLFCRCIIIKPKKYYCGLIRNMASRREMQQKMKVSKSDKICKI